MKYIFVNILMGMYRGGGENYDLNMSQELVNQGHDVELYYLEPMLVKQALTIPQFLKSHRVKAPWLYQWTQRLQLIPGIGKIRGVRGAPRAFGQIIFELRTFTKLWNRRKEEFVVHICGLSLLGYLASTLLRKKVYVRYPGPPSFKLHYWYMNRTYGIIANGDAYYQIERRQPKTNLLELNVGIHNSFFHYSKSKHQARKFLKLSENKIYLLFVGRLVKIKNLPLLLQAFNEACKKFNQLELLIVGDGAEYNSLRKLSEKLSIANKVHFTGEAYGTALQTYYKASDIFILSSHYDNFPNVVLEAMAMKLPVIATNVGGVPSQIEHGITGFLVEPDKTEPMAQHIIELARNPNKRASIGKLAAQHVRERHNWTNSAKLFIASSTNNQN